MEFNDATIQEVDEIMQKSWQAFHIYRKLSLKHRAGFMRAVATELEAAGDEFNTNGHARNQSAGGEIKK
jgi:NADP-dependent aldehyde dehydrogenase